MAYTPINWQTGDTITAEKMNKMDNGWSVTTERTTLFDSSVEFVASDISVNADTELPVLISGDQIFVTYDGTSYECSFVNGRYGDSEFIEYPFYIQLPLGGSTMNMAIPKASAGVHAVKIETDVHTIETSESFDKVRGWGVTTATQTRFDGSVTTAESDGYYRGTITPESSIAADTAIITFNGTEYECPNIGNSRNPVYGATYGESFDWSTYPFNIYVINVGNVGVTTETAGTYTLKIEESTSSIETSESFQKAVETAMPTMPKVLECVEGVTILDEAHRMINNGGIVYFTAAEDSYEGAPKKLFFINDVDRTCTIFPTSTKIIARFGTDDSLFYINHTS